MIQAIGFDLDDTLYEHAQYVYGAYRDVSEAVERMAGIDGRAFFTSIYGHWQLLTSRCNHIFADALRAQNVYSLHLEKHLVEIYRSHEPALVPDCRLIEQLRSLRGAGFRLGLISDGQLKVQQRKVSSLGLTGMFDAEIFTGEWGPEFYKPHERGFKEFLRSLNVAPGEAVYVGDNPLTDFETTKRMGFFTIRVQNGEYKNISVLNGTVDRTFPSAVEAIGWLLLNFKTIEQ